MPKVIYSGQSFECGEQSVLDCLTSQGVAIPSSCHSGLCHTCMVQAVFGDIPKKAQSGLKDTLVAQNCFLPCVCYPEGDIEVTLYDGGLDRLEAMVTELSQLSADILGIHLKVPRSFDYHAGQFINFFKDENTVRSYSLASVPSLDEELFLNVRKVPNGVVSGWMFDQLKVGDTVTISEAGGECFYVLGKPDQNILLIGTGSGLAPLYGIIRDALHSGHKGQVNLYHGCNTAPELYLVDELRKLVQTYANFSYTPCISQGEVPQDCVSGMVLDVALAANPTLSGWRAFLCGHPEMVKSAKQKTFFAGVSMSEIFADPF